ncbi:MAG: NUDIX domain-containing protein [Anaerolineales bacterium]
MGPVKKAAAICYRRKDTSIEILLVRAHGQREAFEEAGVTGQILHKRLTTFLHFKQSSRNTGTEYHVAAFLLLVMSMQSPEEKERQPTWFSPEDAERAIIQFRQFKYAEEYKRVIRLALAGLTGRHP